ncbi:uncharacterized protein LOC141644155 [Silene latifolia]|uniref:uncharacterized protein LOC141644155 n=1 Tax=Silene latifolia TaxID=37657 RepID=UPI003D774AFE
MTTKRKAPGKNPGEPGSTSATKPTTRPKLRAGVNYLGCNLTFKQKLIWCDLTLDKREVLVSKFFDRDALEKLGVLEAVEVLLSRGGLRGFLDKTAPTYRRLTLEFLSTLEKVGDDEFESIRFQLLNQTHVMTYGELRTAFGVAPRENEEAWVSPSDATVADFWFALNHEAKSSITEKSSRLSHPAFRFVHRVIAMDFFCQGEPTNLPRNEIKALWSMSPEGVGHPDWVEAFVNACLETRGMECGKLSMGGLVTLIATQLGLPLDDADRIPGDPRMDIESMKRMKMLAPIASDEPAYALLKGTRVKLPYLRLPRPEGDPIPVGPLNRDLYIPPDPDHMVDLTPLARRAPAARSDGIPVGPHNRDLNIPPDPAHMVDLTPPARRAPAARADDEEIEEAEAGSSGGPRVGGDDAEWRARMEVNMEELRDEIGYIQDQNMESLALQRSFRDMFQRMYPETYQPPSNEMYAKIAQRNQEREARSHARRTRRSCNGSSSS